MKKLLITLGLSVIGFIGYSSAENVNFTFLFSPENEYLTYSPSIITFNEERKIEDNDIINYYCNVQNPEGTCNLWFYNKNVTDNEGTITDENSCNITYDNPGDGIGMEGFYNGCKNYNHISGEYYVAGDIREDPESGEFYNSSFDSITINIPGNNIGGGDSGNGGNSGNGGSIISSGLSAFSGITEKLGSLTSEFIPYIIYIGIGILSITLIIAVVKYILGYLKGQAMGSYNGGGRYSREGMKERRRRRRQQRRRTYTDKDLYNTKINSDDYYKIGKNKRKKRTKQTRKKFGNKYSKTYRTKGYYSK